LPPGFALDEQFDLLLAEIERDAPDRPGRVDPEKGR
jgi:hypothetical protein